MVPKARRTNHEAAGLEPCPDHFVPGAERGPAVDRDAWNVRFFQQFLNGRRVGQRGGQDNTVNGAFDNVIENVADALLAIALLNDQVDVAFSGLLQSAEEQAAEIGEAWVSVEHHNPDGFGSSK